MFFTPSSNIIEIKNLSLHTAEADLLAYFSKFGRVSRCYITRGRQTGYKKNSAFIRASQGTIKAIFVDQESHFLNGSKLKISFQGSEPADKKQALSSDDTNYTENMDERSNASSRIVTTVNLNSSPFFDQESLQSQSILHDNNLSLIQTRVQKERMGI